MLLLGAGESGKSTLLKQMKLIHEEGFSLEERASYVAVVHSNTLQSMNAVIRAMDQLKIGFADAEREDDAVSFFAMTERSPRVTPPPGARPWRGIWADAGTQMCYSRAREYHLNDSAPYFLQALERISQPGYVPSQQDILRTRVKTTGIFEKSFHYKSVLFRMFDVGGQRSERKKWIHCFEGVTAVIYVVALSGYDLLLIEDDTTNRMVECMKLFDSVCNNTWFRNTHMIVFFNKRDLFEEKLPRSPLNVCFPEYRGQNDYESCADFILQKFMALNRQDKNVYPFFTCATDTENIKYVFAAASDIVICKHLADCGLC
ncbi:LOW QUALITY PROTEIN: guanine nucleotide-binding protein G(i) subunit alpha-like [Pollicipes pollicipes]|uniref:LOW QUALITY PROTEIN: guanine nucleotide-binding protein G(i) subunit alpha-like n=1 Tax=Pollicipes pollicipes TaxID=41117 RepID=UPI001884FF24|nr:LOW QUALITY PROTEIN: guanine nucleotide-binding protein G(i) subunit alpha-like [Pollicipes pollicipes]